MAGSDSGTSANSFLKLVDCDSQLVGCDLIVGGS